MCGPQEVYSVGCLFVWREHTVCMHWVTWGAFMTVNVKPICIISAGWCDCILVSLALFTGAFSMIPPCEFSPCKSLTIGPLWWYKGLRIKQGACGCASQRRGEDGVTLTSTETTLILKHMPVFAMTIIGVTVEALCSVPSSRGNPVCALTSELTVLPFVTVGTLETQPQIPPPMQRKHHQLILSWA